MARTQAIIPDAIDAFANNVPPPQSAPPERDDSMQGLMARLMGELLGTEVAVEELEEFRGRWQMRFVDATFELRLPTSAGWGRPELELLSFTCEVCQWAYPCALVQSLADCGRVMQKHFGAHAATAARTHEAVLL